MLMGQIPLRRFLKAPLVKMLAATGGSSSNGGSHAFSGLAIGAAPTGNERRYVVVACGGRGSSGDFTDVTFDGASAEGFYSGKDASAQAAIAWREMPTGTTVDVVIENADFLTGVGYSLYTLVTNADLEVVQAISQDLPSGDWGPTLSKKEGGCAIAVFAGDGAGEPAWQGAWTQDHSYTVYAGDDTEQASTGIFTTNEDLHDGATGSSGDQVFMAVSFR